MNNTHLIDLINSCRFEYLMNSNYVKFKNTNRKEYLIENKS